MSAQTRLNSCPMNFPSSDSVGVILMEATGGREGEGGRGREREREREIGGVNTTMKEVEHYTTRGFK